MHASGGGPRTTPQVNRCFKRRHVNAVRPSATSPSAVRKMSRAIVGRVQARQKKMRPTKSFVVPLPFSRRVTRTHATSSKFAEERELLAFIIDLCQNKEFSYFWTPVSSHTCNLNDYRKKVKQPMDLRTIQARLEGHEYLSAQAVFDDIQLCCDNCLKYHQNDRSLTTKAMALRAEFEKQYAMVCAKSSAFLIRARGPKGVLEVMHMYGMEEVEAVVKLYLSHFSLERELIMDSLMQRYHPYPAAANFTTCTTWVLKRNNVIVAATTLRSHADRSRNVRLVEVLFHAVSNHCLGLGYGSLMACLLQEKASTMGLPKIILHSSLWATKFWKKQGFVDFVEAGRQILKTYVDRNTLQVGCTTPMEYDVVGPRILAIENALLRCRRPPYVLLDHSTRLQPPASRPDCARPIVEVAVISAQSTPATEELGRCTYAVHCVMNHPSSGPFCQPVDPFRMGLPDYPDVVHHPMDLGTVWQRLEQGFYPSRSSVVADINRIWSNCQLYNGPQHPLSCIADELAVVFQKALDSGETMSIPQRPSTRRSLHSANEASSTSSPHPLQCPPGYQEGCVRALELGMTVYIPTEVGSTPKKGTVVYLTPSWARILCIDHDPTSPYRFFVLDRFTRFFVPDQCEQARFDKKRHRVQHVTVRPSATCPAGYIPATDGNVCLGTKVAAYLEKGQLVAGIAVCVPRAAGWVRAYANGKLYQFDSTQQLFVAANGTMQITPKLAVPACISSSANGSCNGEGEATGRHSGKRKRCNSSQPSSSSSMTHLQRLCPHGCTLGSFTKLELGTIVFLVVDVNQRPIAVLIAYLTSHFARGIGDQDQLYDITPSTAFFTASDGNLCQKIGRPPIHSLAKAANMELPHGVKESRVADVSLGDTVFIIPRAFGHLLKGIVVHAFSASQAVVYCRQETYPFYELTTSTAVYVPLEPEAGAVRAPATRTGGKPGIEMDDLTCSTERKERRVLSKWLATHPLKGEAVMVLIQREYHARRKLITERERELRYLDREMHRQEPDEDPVTDGPTRPLQQQQLETGRKQGVDWAKSVGRACPLGYRVGWFDDLFIGLQILIPVDGNAGDLSAVVTSKCSDKARAWCAGWHYELTQRTLFYIRDHGIPLPLTDLADSQPSSTSSSVEPEPETSSRKRHCPAPADPNTPKRQKQVRVNPAVKEKEEAISLDNQPQVPVQVSALCPEGYKEAYVRELALGMEVLVAVVPDRPLWKGLVVHISKAKLSARALARGEFLDLDNSVAFYISIYVQERYKDGLAVACLGNLIPSPMNKSTSAVPRGYRQGKSEELMLGMPVLIHKGPRQPLEPAVVTHVEPGSQAAQTMSCNGKFHTLGLETTFYIRGGLTSGCQ